MPENGEAAFPMPEFLTSFAIQLNGEQYTIEGDAGLLALLERLKMRRNRVAVEINRSIVPRARYDTTRLQAGDTVEIINFVGGG